MSFDKYPLWALYRVAVANICQFGGRFRREPIYVGSHKPPHFNEVSERVNRFISTVQKNPYIRTLAEMAAYGLWRLNWIHPFTEGNGGTARAACYFLLCVRSGALLPERIRENREGYQEALITAGKAWDEGNLDFTIMENYLAGPLRAYSIRLKRPSLVG